MSSTNALKSGLLLTAAALAACHHRPDLKTPASGSLVTEGVVIEATDKSFALRAGAQFKPPFASADCPNLPIASTDFKDAKDNGAVPVRVTYPGLTEPLYGFFLFCQIPEDATGPGSRRYQVQVPGEYVEATSGGRFSVVYELADYANDKGKTDGVPTWILWLSRTPFPAQ